MPFPPAGAFGKLLDSPSFVGIESLRARLRTPPFFRRPHDVPSPSFTLLSSFTHRRVFYSFGYLVRCAVLFLFLAPARTDNRPSFLSFRFSSRFFRSESSFPFKVLEIGLFFYSKLEKGRLLLPLRPFLFFSPPTLALCCLRMVKGAFRGEYPPPFFFLRRNHSPPPLDSSDNAFFLASTLEVSLRTSWLKFPRSLSHSPLNTTKRPLL